MALNLGILGDEVPEAVVLRGTGCPEDLDGVLLFWDEETRAMLEARRFSVATVWTQTRVLLNRYGMWVSLDRHPNV